jgi:hypothetical protein
MSVDQEFQAADYMGDGQDEDLVWIRRSSIYSNPVAAAVLLRFLRIHGFFFRDQFLRLAA